MLGKFVKYKFVLSIVSHGHYDLIASNQCLKQIGLKPDVRIIIKDNIGQPELALFCDENKISYMKSNGTKGFGENNNEVHKYLVLNEIIEPEGWFLLVNPDVVIELDYFNMLANYLLSADHHFYTPNLFRREGYCEHDNSLRHFPKVRDIVNAFFIKPVNRPYNKESLEDGAIIDWASGAFLCVRSDKFESVGGFDQDYFMYFEDVDLCRRLKQIDIDLRFLKSVKAIHTGQHANRKIFSIHFLWYLRSLIRFLFFKRKIT